MLTRKLMTVREVADLAQVSEATVRHWIKEGGLRAIDIGREFRIVPRDLEDFIDQHATSVTRVAGPAGEGTVPGDKARDA